MNCFNRKHALFLLLPAMLLAGGVPETSAREPDHDVVVYGATAGGTVAAIAAAGEGAGVLLVEPGRNVGGMVTGGLSHNDYGDRTVIGGLALEFYGKSDMNSSGPISTNVVNGLNWEYPEADYERRDEIRQAMKEYTLGLLWFLSHDPSVPERIRNETRAMGLCRDEFTGNGHWPHQLYIRVARRMIGEYFMTQHDLERDTVKYDAIGMGSYNIDVRHVQRTYVPVSRFPELHYEVYNEGYISIPVAPYEIPYRSLLPKFTECTNLLVPVCMSASFVANASVRMEPQYMIVGHASGVAAAMAAAQRKPVHLIDVSVLQSRLAGQGQVLSLKENPYGAFRYGDQIIIDNNMKRFIRESGPWRGIETEHNGRYQMNYYLNDRMEGSFGFVPWIGEGGRYEISIRHPSDTSYTGGAAIRITHSGGSELIRISQQEEAGRWRRLGEFELPRGRTEAVTVMAGQSGGTVVADAVRFKKIK